MRSGLHEWIMIRNGKFGKKIVSNYVRGGEGEKIRDKKKYIYKIRKIEKERDNRIIQETNNQRKKGVSVFLCLYSIYYSIFLFLGIIAVNKILNINCQIKH